MENIRPQIATGRIDGNRLKQSIVLRTILIFIIIVVLWGSPRTINGEYFHISMERYPCFGYCPHYTIDIYGSGLVIYKGKKYVHEKWYRAGFVSQQTIRELINLIDSGNVLAFKDHYINSGIDDSMGTIIFVRYKDKSIDTVHYPDGREERFDVAPHELGELETEIEKFAIQWIGDQ